MVLALALGAALALAESLASFSTSRHVVVGVLVKKIFIILCLCNVFIELVEIVQFRPRKFLT